LKLFFCLFVLFCLFCFVCFVLFAFCFFPSQQAFASSRFLKTTNEIQKNKPKQNLEKVKAKTNKQTNKQTNLKFLGNQRKPKQNQQTNKQTNILKSGPWQMGIRIGVCKQN